MANEKATSTTQKPRRPFTQLPPTLAQLVDDRFDEDQYEQAVHLLEQLRAEGVRPSKSLIQKLVALSLCSLAPGQVASTSRWTLDHQFHEIAARLLTQPKGNNRNDRNVMKAASATSDRPSQAAVLKASALLLHYSEATSAYDASGLDTDDRIESERTRSLLARHILTSLPSRRKPLEFHDVSTKSPQRARPSSLHPEDDARNEPFEVSCIERWMQDDLKRAEDVWDLLSGRRSDPKPDSLDQGSEFWMNDTERKRYQKQLQATQSAHQRLEDRLRQLRRKKLNGEAGSDSSDSESGDKSEEDNQLLKLSIPGRSKKRSADVKSRLDKKASSAGPNKLASVAKPAASQRSDNGSQHRNIKMTEGAWRTLSVLLLLWERASPSTAVDEDPPLLWQLPRGHQRRQTGGTESRATTAKDVTDEISPALDLAFSFPSILPAYSPSSTGTAAATDLFDTAKSIAALGHARPISSVAQAELVHRQKIGSQKDERIMAARAEIAAHLLASIYGLVKLGYIRPIAYFEGLSDRIEGLRSNELQYVMLPLIDQFPYVVAKVLIGYLHDNARPHPAKQRTTTRPALQFDFAEEERITVDTSLPFVIPPEEAAIASLQNCSKRDQDRDAKAVLDFLSLHRLELDSSANSSTPLTFPTRSEGQERTLVQKQRQKHVQSDAHASKKIKVSFAVDNKGPDAALILTEEMKKGGLSAFALVRALQMQARDRINQAKFLVARSLLNLHAADPNAQSDAQAEKPHPPPHSDEDLSISSKSQQAGHSRDGDAIEEADSTARRDSLRSFLRGLIKAFERDAAEFGECLSAIKTHLMDDNGVRRRIKISGQFANHGDNDEPAPLPSLEAIVDRCEKYLHDTQNLVVSTQYLSESVL